MMSIEMLGTISRQLDQLVSNTGQPTGVPVGHWNDLVARYNGECQRTAQLQARVDFLQRDVAALEQTVANLDEAWARLHSTARAIEAERDALRLELQQRAAQSGMRTP